MAREMALAGVTPEELTPPPPPEPPKGFRNQCANFWYHYKPFIIVGALLLLIGGGLLLKTLTTNKPDYQVVLITEMPRYVEELDGLEALLESVGEDVDGDGTVEVEVENLTPAFYDVAAPTLGEADMQKLMTYLSTGERMIFVFDRQSYEGFEKTIVNVTSEGFQFFEPLSTDAAGYNTEEHYWNWIGDPRLAEYGLSDMDDDLFFGVRSPEGMAARSKSRELCEQGLVLIQNLAE